MENYSTEISEAQRHQLLIVLEGELLLHTNSAVKNLNMMSCHYLDDDFKVLENLDKDCKILLIKSDFSQFADECDELTLALIDEDFFSEDKAKEYRESSAEYIKNRLKLNSFKTMNTDKPIVESITEFIDQHLDEKLSVEMIAEEFSLSRMKLIRLFQKNDLGSVMNYVKKLRLEKAKVALEESDLNISQIAASCGFADTASFSHFIKKNLDKSPSQLRSEKQWLI